MTLSVVNVPDEEDDENCSEAVNEKVPRMRFKFNCQESLRSGVDLSEGRDE